LIASEPLAFFLDSGEFFSQLFKASLKKISGGQLDGVDLFALNRERLG
jgi:hypothetical protein